MLLDDQIKNYSNNKGLLTIQRTSQWANRIRAIKIIIDGTKVASINNGKSLDLDLDPGVYQIQVKIDWCKTKVFNLTIQPYQTISLETGCHYRGWKLWAPFIILYYLFVRPSSYLYLVDKSQEESTI